MSKIFLIRLTYPVLHQSSTLLDNLSQRILRLLYQFFHYLEAISCCPWSHGLWPKNFKVLWWCHQLLSGFLAKGQLFRVSHQSRSLMIRLIMNGPGGCRQLSCNLPYSRGKPLKTSARRSSDEGAVRPFIASNGVSFLQMRPVGSLSD